jgi:hypothetical protein
MCIQQRVPLETVYSTEISSSGPTDRSYHSGGARGAGAKCAFPATLGQALRPFWQRHQTSPEGEGNGEAIASSPLMPACLALHILPFEFASRLCGHLPVRPGALISFLPARHSALSTRCRECLHRRRARRCPRSIASRFDRVSSLDGGPR